jgi:YVTN family beta-propeller protein
MGCNGDQPADEQQVFSTRTSRSSAIAIADDDAHIAMVNPDDGSLTVFQTSDHVRTAKLATGGNPSSVVIAPDGKTAYVANRADGTVVRVTGLDGAAPAINATVDVGAEPAGLALSPSGKRLFVAEYAIAATSFEPDRSAVRFLSFRAVATGPRSGRRHRSGPRRRSCHRDRR